MRNSYHMGLRRKRWRILTKRSSPWNRAGEGGGSRGLKVAYNYRHGRRIKRLAQPRPNTITKITVRKQNRVGYIDRTGQRSGAVKNQETTVPAMLSETDRWPTCRL